MELPKCLMRCCEGIMLVARLTFLKRASDYGLGCNVNGFDLATIFMKLYEEWKWYLTLLCPPFVLHLRDRVPAYFLS